VPDEVEAALKAAVIAPILKLDKPDSALRVMKRKWADADVYLFFNEGAQVSRHEATLMSRGRTVEAWDVQTGMEAPVKATMAGGHPVLELDLKPYETTVLVVR
jgi:hypothetical protein